MEQFFNFGSQGLRDRLAAKEDSFDEIVGELTGVKPKDIHPLFTWRHEHSDMHDHVEKFCDDATREGVDAMIRQRRDGFLQNHITSRVFPGANKYFDVVAVSDNFKASRASSDTIAALLHVTDEGETMAAATTIATAMARWAAAKQVMTKTTMATGDADYDDDDDDGALMMMMMTTMASNNFEAIQKVLATFNRESQRAVDMSPPMIRFFARDTNEQ